MLTLSAGDSEEICDLFDAADKSETINFLRSMPIFASWSRSRLARLSEHVVNSIYPTGELVVRQVRAGRPLLAWIVPELRLRLHFLRFHGPMGMPRHPHVPT